MAVQERGEAKVCGTDADADTAVVTQAFTSCFL